MLGFADQKPIVLNNAQPQLGYTFINEYSYYVGYYDSGASSVNVQLIPKAGTATMFISTTDSHPTSSSYEYSGTDVTILGHGQQFVYVGVACGSGSPGVCAFDVLFTRK